MLGEQQKKNILLNIERELDARLFSAESMEKICVASGDDKGAEQNSSVGSDIKKKIDACSALIKGLK